MRLTDKKIADVKEYLARSMKVTASSLIPKLSKYGLDLIDTIEALQKENEQLKKERDQAIRDIDKGNCRNCVYDGKKICYGNMHGKDREVAKEQGLPYCIGWQWRGLEGRE